jgi:hypothetical protein
MMQKIARRNKANVRIVYTACFLESLVVEDPTNGKPFWFGSYEDYRRALTIILQFVAFNVTI